MIIQLRAAGTSFVLDARGPQPAVIVGWGPDLGDLADGDLAALAAAAVPAVPPSSLDDPYLMMAGTPGFGFRTGQVGGAPGVER